MRTVPSLLLLSACVASGRVAPAQEPCFLTKHLAPDPEDDDRFGQAVAIAGGVAVCGAFKHDDNGLNSGSAYVFRFDGLDWVFEQELLGSDSSAQDRFGWSVDTDGERIVVGARADDDPQAGGDTGAAYVFAWNGSAWFEEQKLVALDADAGDELGTSVALDGLSVLLGADGDDEGGSDAGAAYLFERVGQVWLQADKLLAADAAAGAGFGGSVALDGTLAVVGAPLDSPAGSMAGAAYLFRAGPGGWAQETKLLPADLAANDRLGSSVSASGASVLVGAMNAPSSGANDSGAAYVFTRVAGTWVEEQKLEASDSSLGDLFGWSVALDGDAAIVGAYLEDGSGADAGAAYLYGRSAGSWTQRAKLVADDTEAHDAFGFSVDLCGEHVYVGAWGDDEVDDETGSAYLFAWVPSIGTNYCSGEPNSVGDGAVLAATGSAFVVRDDFSLTARCVVPGVPGLFFLGRTMVDLPFGEGRRCAGGMTLRLNPPVFADASGTATRAIPLGVAPAAGNVLPGSSWNAQLWYRDSLGGPQGFNLSDAVHLDFQ